MIDVPIKAKVECTDGTCGKSTHVIVDPDSGKLTHVVIKNKKLPDSPDRLVPVEKVADIVDKVIHLTCSWDELSALPPFTTIHYVQKEIPDYVDSYAVGTPVPPLPQDTWIDKAKDKHIPADELALSRGMEIQTQESKKVGEIDGLVVDPDSGVISHLLMQKGHLWGKKDVMIPVSAIEFIDADTVYLHIDKAAIEDLPTVPLK